MPKRISELKQGLLFLLIVVISFRAAAQSATETFTITMPAEKVSNSLYQTIRLVDVRPEPGNLGIVQLGAFNRKARVVTATPLAEQLSALVSALTDETAKHGELFLLLRQLSFAEVTGAMSERGYFHFRAALFAKQNDRFVKLDAVDTVLIVKAMDVTRGLLRQGSKSLTELIAANLSKEPADSVSYSSTEVVQFDQIEKRSVPLYAATELKNGIYKTFRSFAAQQPDVDSLDVEFSKTNKPVLKKLNEKGRWEKVHSKDVYAFVHEGNPFVATDFGYYPLTKKEADFYFTGRAKVAANSSDVMMASLFFGVIGGLIASSPGNAVFEMKLDHLSGGFIRLQEVRQQSTNSDAVYRP